MRTSGLFTGKKVVEIVRGPAKVDSWTSKPHWSCPHLLSLQKTNDANINHKDVISIVSYLAWLF